MNPEHAIRTYWTLAVVILLGLGLVLVLTTVAAAQRPATEPGTDTDPASIASPAADACFATHDDGANVESSANGSAVQKAVNAALPGDTVKIAGTCKGTGMIDGHPQTVYISKSLTLQGGYTHTNWLAAPNPEVYTTTLDADKSGRVVYLTGTITVRLEDLVIQHGDVLGANDGAGIYHGDAATTPTLTIDNSLIYSNTSAADGGGLYVADNALVTITNSIVSDNWAEKDGAGVDVQMHVDLIIDETTIKENNADDEGGGIYLEGPNSLELSNSWVLTNTTGDDDGAGLFMDGEGQNQILISNTQFLGNRSGRGGGAIQQDSGNGFTTLTITHSILSDNTAVGEGGALYQSDAAVTILDTTISDNQATRGGGVYSAEDTTLVFSNSQVISNTAREYGGGLYNLDRVSVSESTFEGNEAKPSLMGGGAIWTAATLTVTQSSFLYNKAPRGGAIFQDITGTMHIANSTFYSNTAIGGGAIHNRGLMTVTHATVANNRAPTGSGIHTWNGENYLYGSIVADNAGGDQCQPNALDASIDNLNNDGTCDGAAVGDPMLVPPADNGGSTLTMALQPGSAALNAIAAADCRVGTDQRGVSRPQGTDCDIGAYEIPYFRLTVSRAGSGVGTVTGPGIDCGADCDETFIYGAAVTLTATAEMPSTFAGWSGDCTGTAPNCSVKLMAPRDVTATFALPGAFLPLVLKGP